MSQLNPVYSLTSHVLKIYLNIILPFTPGSTQWSLSLRFPHQNPIYDSPLSHTRYMPRPYHSYRFYNRTILGEQYISLSSLLHSPVTASLWPKYSPEHPISNTLSLRSSFNVVVRTFQKLLRYYKVQC